MQEIIGGPSLTPTYSPSSQPATLEVPPASDDIAVPDKATLTVLAWKLESHSNSGKYAMIQL